MFLFFNMEAWLEGIKVDLDAICAQGSVMLQVAAVSGAAWKEPNKRQYLQMERRTPAARTLFAHAAGLLFFPLALPTQAWTRYWTSVIAVGMARVERALRKRKNRSTQGEAYTKRLERVLTDNPYLMLGVTAWQHLTTLQQSTLLDLIERKIAKSAPPGAFLLPARHRAARVFVSACFRTCLCASALALGQD